MENDKQKYNYKEYTDIPEIIKEYIEMVIGIPSVEGVPIHHINSYLNEMEDWYNINTESFEPTMVLETKSNRSYLIH